jgi:SH3-like domain-containing protein
VTIKSENANIRTGPGKRYPIKWEVVRKGIPLEVVSEFEQWRKVRDFQGEEGWIFQTMLSGARAVVVQSKPQILRKSDSASSRPIAKLDVGVVAKLKSCTKEWCNIEKDDLEGWLPRTSVWGVYPNESLNR